MSNTWAASIPPRQVIGLTRFTNLPLVRMGRDGKGISAAAAAWHTSDRRTWTVTLRDDLRGPNGQRLTAAVIRKLLVDRLPNEATVHVAASDVESIEAPSPTTLVYRLRRPSNAFVDLLALPASYLPAGPFRLVNETPTHFAFQAADNFPDGVSNRSEVHLDFVRSPRAAWAALLRADADVLYYVSPGSASLLARHPDIRLYADARVFMHSLGFQLRHPVLRQPQVRQALNLAIDRKSIVEHVFGGYTEPARGPFSPDYWAAANAGDVWPYDPARARAILARAVGARGVIKELVCVTSNELPLVGEVAAAVEAQLRRIGVRIRLVPLPLARLTERLVSGDFDLFVMTHRVDNTMVWPYMLWHSGTVKPKEYRGIRYASADAGLDALYTAASPEAERAAVRAVLTTMHADPPAAFIAAEPRIHAVRRVWNVPEHDAALRDSVHRWTRNDLDPCGSSHAR